MGEITDSASADAYAASLDKGDDLPLPPARKVAVLACMDARLIPYGILGLQEGDAHVIRNAGGVVTDDEIRSLAVSQRLLATEQIILIHHTDCGMLTFTDDAFKADIQAETRIKPEWAAEAFPDLDDDVRQSIARIKASPFIPRKDSVRGFVYDVHSGELREVQCSNTDAVLTAERERPTDELERPGESPIREVSKAIFGNSYRLELLASIAAADGPFYAREFAARLGIPDNLITTQLGRLAEIDLLTRERSGPRVVYQRKPSLLWTFAQHLHAELVTDQRRSRFDLSAARDVGTA